MRRSSVLLLSSVVSVGAWMAGQRTLGSAVRRVAATAAHASGERIYLLDDDHMALLVGPTSCDDPRTQVFGVSLLRWYVNVIAAPILAMTLGSTTVLPRLLVGVFAVVATVALDGVSVFFYLLLGVHRLRGAPLLATSVDDRLAYGIAVIGKTAEYDYIYCFASKQFAERG